MNVKKMVTLALFTTVALTIYLLESVIPTVVPIPGVKLGLSNIITLYVMIKYGNKDAFLVLITRILLASIFAGQMMSLLYSLLGGCLCFSAMCIINKLLHNRYIYITSVIGAIFHNVGQLIAAMLVLQSVSVLAYFYILLISGVVTGLFTGLCTHFLIVQFRKITSKYVKNN